MVSRKLVKCRNCDKKLSITFVYRHEKICLAEKEYPCTFVGCGKVFNLSEQRTRHVRKVHCPPISCPMEDCSRSLKPESLSSHIALVHGKVSTKCHKCRQIMSAPYLPIHNRTCHSNFARLAKSCDSDESSSIDDDDWDEQMIKNNQRILVPCTFKGCEMTMKKSSLPQHIRNIHERLEILCSRCGKKIIEQLYDSHQKICKDDAEYKYKCTVKGCKKAFATAKDRSSHKRIHRLPIPCPHKDCDSVLKPSSLSKHIRVMHKD